MYFRLRKLFVHIELDQLSLDLCDQITVILVDYKAHRATTPLGTFVKLGKPLPVLFVLGVKDYPWPTM
jgi:hypothetical protein